jgi:hypothetical protein
MTKEVVIARIDHFTRGRTIVWTSLAATLLHCVSEEMWQMALGSGGRIHFPSAKYLKEYSEADRVSYQLWNRNQAKKAVTPGEERPATRNKTRTGQRQQRPTSG